MNKVQEFSRALEIRDKYPDLSAFADTLSQIAKAVYNMGDEKQKAFSELQEITGIKLTIERMV